MSSSRLPRPVLCSVDISPPPHTLNSPEDRSEPQRRVRVSYPGKSATKSRSSPKSRTSHTWNNSKLEYGAVPPDVNRVIPAPLAHNKPPIILIPEVTDGGRPPVVKRGRVRRTPYLRY